MQTKNQQYILDQLHWRYATKQFDSARKISPEDWATLETALVLSPSSYGLQPWKFIIVSAPAIRSKLKASSWGQSQITDASHLVVFTVKTNLGDQDVAAFLKRISEVRNVSIESLEQLRAMMVDKVVHGMDETARRSWESRQLYIALGTLLTTAALLGIDACPMEGFAPLEYDAILGLEAKGLTTMAVCALGYRSAADKYALLPKVRFRAEDVLAYV
jgi:nitroreductase